MAIITLPAGLRMGAGGGMGQQRFDLLSQSDSTGTQQTRLLGPPRWTLQLVQPPALQLAEAGAWAALLLQLRGRVNVLAAWDVARPVPLGTARGSMTTSGTTAAGATVVSIVGATATGTLLAGDWLQIGDGLGSHYAMVTAPATADGAGAVTVSFEPPVRASIVGGTALAWDKPLAYYRLQADASAWTYGPGLVVSGMALDLLEVWS
jgi:hypothetical protein